MIKIPKNLKIGGRLYEIKYPYHFKERGDLVGQHDGDMQVIRVDDKDSYAHGPRPDSSVYITLIHEILHAVDYITGHHIFKDNENAIEGFSEILYQILVDNGYLK